MRREQEKRSLLHKTDHRNTEILPPKERYMEFPDDTGSIQMNIALCGKHAFTGRCDQH